MPRSHIPRTNSEAQLDEDTAAAEFRDLCMFYRVVNGIRDRQASNSMETDDQLDDDFGIQKSGGNSIISRHHSHPNQSLDAVTPYQSSNEASPHAYTYFEGYLAQQPCPGVEPNSIVEGGDDWSISGYDDPETRTHHRQNDVPIVEADDDNEDDGVFNMEL